jgi:uroporphyrinogen decarboxylase
MQGMESDIESGSPGFAGLHVAAFESRRAAEMARLIERLGGVPHVSPSMRETPVENPASAIDFAHRLMAGRIDVVVLTTGVGARRLVEQISKQMPRERFLIALKDAITIARGPKPVAALKELGIEPTHRVAEPNTWREVLKLIDREMAIANQTVAVQEYGKPNASLVAGLEARGATVLAVKVYEWDFPEDLAPLEENLRRLASGAYDAVLFTSAHQAVNVLRMAQGLGIDEEVRAALNRVAVASIGPTTSEMLRELELPVDIEPEHSKMGQLVVAAARNAPGVLARKRLGRSGPTRIRLSSDSVPTADRPAWESSPFMKACRREPCERTPVWLMRQAGRYMAEYREVRAKTTFLELCKNPRLCADVMLTAVDRLGVDAAIIFADLLPMLEPMGMDLEFAQGEGPVIHNPIREASEVDCLLELNDLAALEFVFETVRLTRAGLPEHIPVIGFAGAPFTLASYAIEGGASRNYLFTKRLMYREEGAWHALMARLARGIAAYLNAQIAAGAQCVQLFDSWVGCLGPDDYRRYVLPHTRSIVQAIAPGTPVINFGTGNPALLELYAEAGGDVIGVDWRIRLDEAWRIVGHDRGVQGNLDPLVLLATPEEIRRRAGEVLAQAAGRPGHIFNLGHGIVPQTPVENVIALVDAVRELSARPAS